MKSIEQRFDAKWRPELKSGCWLWIGSKCRGYGRMTVFGVSHVASRVSWELFNGEIPKGKFVCHKCDVPSCVNPDHLFLANHAENIKDSYDKGRSNQKGQRNGNAQLHQAEVQEIRNSSESCRALATRFGIGKSQVANIKKGLQWKNL